MSIAAQVGRAAVSLAHAERVDEFIGAVRFMLLNGGSYQNTPEHARASGLNERQIDYVAKAAVAPHSLADTALAPHTLTAAFLASLIGTAVFETMLPFMIRLPLRTTIAAVSVAITGATPSEMSVKPISRFSVGASDLDQAKASAIVAVTRELLRASGTLADAVLRRELSSAVIRATDSQFLSLITAGAPSFASSGVTALGARQDLRTLLQSVPTGTTSKLFWIVNPTIAKAWSVLADSTGNAAFPGARFNGGEIGGIPILSSDQVASDEIILTDAGGIACAAGDLALDVSENALIQLETSPDSPPTAATNMVSFFQMNYVGFRAERFFGAKLLNASSVAKITGAAYSGNSPS